jgi:hypothetical protein
MTSRFPLTVWAVRHIHRNATAQVALMPLTALAIVMFYKWDSKSATRDFEFLVNSLALSSLVPLLFTWTVVDITLKKCAHCDKEKWRDLFLSGPAPLDYMVSLFAQVIVGSCYLALPMLPPLALHQLFTGGTFAALLLAPFIAACAGAIAFSGGLILSTIFPGNADIGKLGSALTIFTIFVLDLYISLGLGKQGIIMNTALWGLGKFGPQDLLTLEWFILGRAIPLTIALLVIAYFFVRRMVRLGYGPRPQKIRRGRVRPPKFMIAGPAGNVFVGSFAWGGSLFACIAFGAVGIWVSLSGPLFDVMLCGVVVAAVIFTTMAAWGMSPEAGPVVLTDCGDGALYRAMKRVLSINAIGLLPALLIVRLNVFSRLDTGYSIMDLTMPPAAIAVSTLDAFVTLRALVLLTFSATLAGSFAGRPQKKLLQRLAALYLLPCFLFLEVSVKFVDTLREHASVTQMFALIVVFMLVRMCVYYIIGNGAKNQGRQHIWYPVGPVTRPVQNAWN